MAKANVDLTTKTAVAGKTTAASSVQTARSNVDQTQLAAAAKRSQITQAQAAVRTAQANLAQTRAQLPQAESNVKLAETEYNRRLALFQKGDISQQSLDLATNALQNAQSQLNAAEKQVAAAQSRVDEANAGVATANDTYRQSLAQVDLTRSQVDESKGRLADAAAAPERIGVTEAQVDSAESQIAAAEVAVHQAEVELSYTKIYAPADGYVTKKTIEEGQLIQAGTPLMAISQSSEVWVVANFKETQLENMRIGQPVDIKVDAYPGQSFKGKSRAFRSEPAHASAYCRPRMPPGIMSRSFSVCRSRSYSTLSPTTHICSHPECRLNLRSRSDRADDNGRSVRTPAMGPQF